MHGDNGVQQRHDDEPILHYRCLLPHDCEALRAAHQALFPIDYEDAFYQAAVRAEQGIISVAAFYRNNSEEELAGFLTARICCLRDCSSTDRVLLGLNSSLLDGYNALYILTVGVLEPLRHRGVGSKLLAAILEQARERSCLSIFLHVIDYNEAAITFYRRNCFQEIALLHDFYYIGSGRQRNPEQTRYNAYLYALPLEVPKTCPFRLWAILHTLFLPLRRLLTHLHLWFLWTLRSSRRLRSPGALEKNDIELGLTLVSRP